MDKISSDSLEVRKISGPAEELLEIVDNRRKGKSNSLKTPWKKYNQVSMGGIEWWTIHGIGGMSGHGKTAILNMLETKLIELNPNEEFDILSFNFEMLAYNLVGRKVANAMDLTTQELYSASQDRNPISDIEYATIKDHLDKIKELNIYYVEEAGTIEQIEKTILSFARSQPLERGVVVTLDHTLLVGGRSGEEERIILKRLLVCFNNLKKKLHKVNKKISFIVLTQLNRDLESPQRQNADDRSQEFPKKSDVFGGDSLYMFADVIMISMCPEKLNKQDYGPFRWPTASRLYWHFIKVREGENIVAMMKNELKYSRVVDWEEESQSVQYDLNF